MTLAPLKVTAEGKKASSQKDIQAAVEAAAAIRQRHKGGGGPETGVAPRLALTAANEVLPQREARSERRKQPAASDPQQLRMTDKLAPTHTFVRLFKPEVLPPPASSDTRSSSNLQNGIGAEMLSGLLMATAAPGAANSDEERGDTIFDDSVASSISNERSATDAIATIANVVDARERAPVKLTAAAEKYGELTNVIDQRMHHSNNINRKYGVPSWVPMNLRSRSVFKLRV
jgi:hypothetical protein